MVCLRNICINTLHKGDNEEDYDDDNDDDDDDDNNNNNNTHFCCLLLRTGVNSHAQEAAPGSNVTLHHRHYETLSNCQVTATFGSLF